jgi:hypothetical protein
MLLLVPGEGYGEERRVKCRTGPGQVGAWPPRLASATTDAAVSGPVALAVLVQAAVSSAIATAAAQVAGCGEQRGREPGRAVCADTGCPLARGA